MKIVYLGSVVGDLTSEGLIRDIAEQRLTEVAKDVLLNGVVVTDFIFHEDDKGEARTNEITHGDEEYPAALWHHLQDLGYEVEDFPMELEKARFAGFGKVLTVGLPYGAKKYGTVLEQQIQNTLKFAVQKGIAKFKQGMTKAEMDGVFQKAMDRWLSDLLGKLKPIAWNLMQTGLIGAGLDEQQFTNAHKLAMDYLEEHPHSILNAVKTLNEDQKQAASKVLDEAFKGDIPWDLKKVKAAIMERADVGATRAELIARTEMAKISNLGRIMAWEQDPLNADYDYWWVAVHDAREKSASKEFERGSPYTLEQIKALWLNPVSPTTGENDAFNQRCGVARTRKRL